MGRLVGRFRMVGGFFTTGGVDGFFVGALLTVGRNVVGAAAVGCGVRLQASEATLTCALLAEPRATDSTRVLSCSATTTGPTVTTNPFTVAT